MTAEPDLLPLPEPTGNQIVLRGDDFQGDYNFYVSAFTGDQLEAYAHANVARAIAAKDAEIEALRAEVERLRALAGCAYQMAGMHDAPLVWLDRLSEAANGDALPDVDTLMDELLPYQPDAACEAESRADKLAEALRECIDNREGLAYESELLDRARALLRDQEEWK